MPSVPFDDNGNEGRKFDRTKSGVGTFGRRHNTMGRTGANGAHNGTEEFKDGKPADDNINEEEEKRSEKDEIDTPEKV
jgi:hypothetical protein